ncbi:MAG: methionine adenosyltransferase [Muribaculaceae bacterium]|nr:methionine adenosyltransferase [Muribaculaceae bacterium]
MEKKNYLFTSESVSEGHPDKVADQISDAILDQFLAYDPQSKVACETMVTTGQVIVAGEVKSNAYIDLMDVTRQVISKIGYTKSEFKFDADACGVLSALHEQSPDINRGVERDKIEEQGAGDQGMMFGYACNETPDLMPLSLSLAHLIMRELAELRKGKLLPYLRPDAKSQVTVEYDSVTHKPVRIHTIVISTQHDEFIKPEDKSEEAQKRADDEMLERIRHDMETVLLPRVLRRVKEEERALFDDQMILHVNPTGKFVIGGPHGDTGLTGRKIIVDTYGGRGAHGGGAFSGKDPSKVDRSAAYAARHIAKNAVAAGIADEMLVQISYAIGKADPVSFYVNTYGTSHVKQTDSEIAGILQSIFDMRPHAIEQRLKLRYPIYEETAAYGHMGRTPKVVTKHFTSKYEGDLTMDVELFTWEKLDHVEILKNAFGL